jgi:hypothetical protein
LLAGNTDPGPGAPALLRRALAALPEGAGQIKLRADAGYFAVDLPSPRTGPASRSRSGPSASQRCGAPWPVWVRPPWVDAIDMPGAQVAVANYIPARWPTDTRLLIRRVRLDCDQISSDPRFRRRRTVHPDQRALPIDELAAADAVYGYSFILTNQDVTTPARAAAIEHWYRHRTEIENIFRDAKHGAALRHLPSGYERVNRAWMWGALIATSIAGWLHQLAASPDPGGGLLGWGARDGKAMIPPCDTDSSASPAGSSTTPANSSCAYHPAATTCSTRSSPACAPYPQRTDQAKSIRTSRTPPTRGDARARSLPITHKNTPSRSTTATEINSRRYSPNRVRHPGKAQ